MSWKTKPSATAQIPTRAEPYLDASTKARYERDILPKYPNLKAALLPILQDIQHRCCHIPAQAMVEIASFLKITPAEVMDTVSFYEEFSREPRGKVIISVCQSFVCEACDSQPIVDEVKLLLGIDEHETTPCGTFMLLPLECLGSCDTAPVALFGETLHENLTVERVRALVDEAKTRARASGDGRCCGGGGCANGGTQG
ncbi:MAG: NAD(P)H-dependent oxidoreductase subunit E [Planctomycetota bacterium]|nr:NAD(P)H-dependent oxidoreductase subunit E [Planctomycetota bacterium]